MTAKEFYDNKAIKHQLKRAIKHDKQYFEDAIIELMEMYAQEQIKYHEEKLKENKAIEQ